ncbi:MAG TPA: hypothetical protein VGJ02_06285 [Pyrinomonadaceae bacterium]|jgi:hypothetical protein
MKVNRKWVIALAMPALMLLASHVFAQADQKPVFSGYKGVMIGMPMSDARSKLGSARDKSDEEDYYVYNDKENCQVLYGHDKTVRVISVTYLGKDAPTAMEVLGVDAAAKPEGGINKRIDYPKAGYSVSYLKTKGDDPMVIVTVQKMLVAQ